MSGTPDAAAEGPAAGGPGGSRDGVAAGSGGPAAGLDPVDDGGRAGSFDHPDSLAAIALRSAPSIAALRERTAAAREMSRAAGALDDPMVSFGLNGERYPGKMLGQDPMVMGTVMLSQAIPWPGKRGLRKDAAEAETGRNRAEWESLRRQVVSQVRGMYADLYAMDGMGGALRESKEALDLLEQSAASRYAAGLSMQKDLLEVQLQRSRLAEQRDDLTAERAAMTARLNAMLDRPADTLVRTGILPGVTESSAYPAFSDTTGALDSLAVARAPDVVVRRQAVEAARLRLALARREAWPNLVPGVEYGWRNGMPPMVTATLGVELPVWKSGKQDAEARAAAHDLEMARADLRMAEAEARGEAARLRAARAAAAGQVDRYRNEIVPRSNLLLESSRTAYATGTGDSIRETVEAFRMLVEARAGLARREADLYKTEVAQSELIGSDPLIQQEGESR